MSKLQSPSTHFWPLNNCNPKRNRAQTFACAFLIVLGIHLDSSAVATRKATCSNAFASAPLDKKNGLSSKLLWDFKQLIESLRPDQLGTHFLREIQPPPFLFHWISIKSLNRWKEDTSVTGAPPSVIPQKPIGSSKYKSMLYDAAPSLQDKTGLYSWHNPFGARIGGSGEMYGNSEALLTMKISPQARVGILIANSAEKQQVPGDIAGKYDLLLHYNGEIITDSNGKIKYYATLIEWVVLNPEIVLEATTDLKVAKQSLSAHKKYMQQHLNSQGNDSVEEVFGPQHYGMDSMGMNLGTIEEGIGVLNKIEKNPEVPLIHTKQKY